MSRTFKPRNPYAPAAVIRPGAGEHKKSEKAKRNQEKSEFRKNLNRDWF